MDKRLDLAVALTFATLGVVIILLAQDIPKGDVADPVGERGVPVAIGLCLAGTAAIVALRVLARWKNPDAPIADEEELTDVPASTGRVLGVFFVLVGYVALLPLAGYAVSTVGFLMAGMWLMEVRSARKLVFVSVGFTLAVLLLVTVVLGLPLPNWRLLGDALSTVQPVKWT